VRTLVGIVLAADQDKDFLLSDDEIEEIISRVESIHGVQIKEDMFRQRIIDNGRSIKSIMMCARNLMVENDPQKNIFSFVE
jgi:hypothetical protein